MPLFRVFCVTGWKSADHSAGNFCVPLTVAGSVFASPVLRLRNSAFNSATFLGSLTIVTRGKTSFQEICRGRNRRHIPPFAGTFDFMLRAYPDH